MSFERGQTNFFEVAEAFLATKRGKRTREIYSLTIKRLKEYAGENLSLEEMRPNWLREFYANLKGSVNGRAIHLRNIRAIFNYAIDEELIDFYPFRKFKIKKEETRKRSMSVENLRRFLNLTDLTEMEEESRDMFMLTFYLIGINLVDLSKLTCINIVNGRLEYRRTKTGRLYSIKIEPEAMEIIERYAGVKGLLSPFDRYANYRDYNFRINLNLKRLGEYTGRRSGNGTPIRIAIEPDCSTYWARHTWATIAYSIGVSKETIAAALGHTYGNRVTAIYIDKRSAGIDEANRKVIDYVVHNKKGLP